MTLWFRCRPDPDTVRETLSTLPPLDPPLVQSFFGEIIVSLRGDVLRAREALDNNDPQLAKQILDAALEVRS